MIKATAEKNLVKIAERFLKEKIENEFLNVKVNKLELTLELEYKNFTTFHWDGETDILNRYHRLYGMGMFNDELIKFTMMDDKSSETFTIKL